MIQNPLRIVRFGVVTDIHYGFDQAHKKGSQAPRLIERFFKKTNDNDVDFTVDLGDRVIFKNLEQDRAYLRKLKEHFNTAAQPHYSVHGNHDLGHMTREDNEEILGVPGGSYSRDINGVHFIFWNPNVRVNGGKEMHVFVDELEWLRQDLAATSLPCALFSHVPLDNKGSETYIDKKDPTKWVFPSAYEEAPEIRQILEQSGKVKLCMAGHRHFNRHREINGIHYVIQQSLVQRNIHTGYARGAYSLVEMSEDGTIRIKGYGVGQKSRTLNVSGLSPS